MSNKIGDTFRDVRLLIEAYTTPEQFPSPKDYLQALTEGLDNLAITLGAEPPERHDVWSPA